MKKTRISDSGLGLGQFWVTAESEQVNQTIRLVSESETSMIDVLRDSFYAYKCMKWCFGIIEQQICNLLFINV